MNPLAVFPDCLVMWDDPDLPDNKRVDRDLKATSTPTDRRNPPVNTHPFASDRSLAENRASVQYHIHYYPWNVYRLMAAFFVGGAIALALVFFILKTYFPSTLNEGELEQAQMPIER